MDKATNEDWVLTFGAIAARNQSFPDRILALLENLKEQNDGYAINQLQHGLQTATRALRDRQPDEVVVAALCHDLGKVILNKGHPEISAAILKTFVSYETYMVIKTHQDFQCRYYSEITGADPNAREKYKSEPWFSLACKFSDEWDQCSFDPEYDTLPLSEFEEKVRVIFSPEKNNSYFQT